MLIFKELHLLNCKRINKSLIRSNKQNLNHYKIRGLSKNQYNTLKGNIIH